MGMGASIGAGRRGPFVQSHGTHAHLMSSSREFILTLSCRDIKGIVYAVSGLLFEAGCNIVDSQQYGDVLSSDATGLFFMRVHFEAPAALADPAALERLVAPLRTRFSMELVVHSLARKPRLLL